MFAIANKCFGKYVRDSEHSLGRIAYHKEKRCLQRVEYGFFYKEYLLIFSVAPHKQTAYLYCDFASEKRNENCGFCHGFYSDKYTLGVI